LEFPDFSDLARNTFCVMAASTVNERVFSMNGHVVNSKRANLNRSPVNDILFFNSRRTLKAEKETLKVD